MVRERVRCIFSPLITSRAKCQAGFINVTMFEAFSLGKLFIKNKKSKIRQEITEINDNSSCGT